MQFAYSMWSLDYDSNHDCVCNYACPSISYYHNISSEDHILLPSFSLLLLQTFEVSNINRDYLWIRSKYVIFSNHEWMRFLQSLVMPLRPAIKWSKAALNLDWLPSSSSFLRSCAILPLVAIPINVCIFLEWDVQQGVPSPSPLFL